MSLPTRSCVGCGRRAPQDELLRFAADTGRLVAGRDRRGRGAYTCPRISCFERAKARRAFSRALRRTVEVDQSLSGLYTGVNG